MRPLVPGRCDDTLGYVDLAIGDGVSKLSQHPWLIHRLNQNPHAFLYINTSLGALLYVTHLNNVHCPPISTHGTSSKTLPAASASSGISARSFLSLLICKYGARAHETQKQSHHDIAHPEGLVPFPTKRSRETPSGQRGASEACQALWNPPVPPV